MKIVIEKHDEGWKDKSWEQKRICKGDWKEGMSARILGTMILEKEEGTVLLERAKVKACLEKFDERGQECRTYI